MDRKNRKKVHLDLYLKILFKNGKAREWHRQSLNAFFRLLRGCPLARNYYIWVKYYPGIINDGNYSTKKDLLFAARAFTNYDELDFIANY